MGADINAKNRKTRRSGGGSVKTSRCRRAQGADSACSTPQAAATTIVTDGSSVSPSQYWRNSLQAINPNGFLRPNQLATQRPPDPSPRRAHASNEPLQGQRGPQDDHYHVSSHKTFSCWEEAHTERHTGVKKLLSVVTKAGGVAALFLAPTYACLPAAGNLPRPYASQLDP